MDKKKYISRHTGCQIDTAVDSISVLESGVSELEKISTKLDELLKDPSNSTTISKEDKQLLINAIKKGIPTSLTEDSTIEDCAKEIEKLGISIEPNKHSIFWFMLYNVDLTDPTNILKGQFIYKGLTKLTDKVWNDEADSYMDNAELNIVNKEDFIRGFSYTTVGGTGTFNNVIGIICKDVEISDIPLEVGDIFGADTLTVLGNFIEHVPIKECLSGFSSHPQMRYWLGNRFFGDMTGTFEDPNFGILNLIMIDLSVGALMSDSAEKYLNVPSLNSSNELSIKNCNGKKHLLGINIPSSWIEEAKEACGFSTDKYIIPNDGSHKMLYFCVHGIDPEDPTNFSKIQVKILGIAPFKGTRTDYNSVLIALDTDDIINQMQLEQLIGGNLFITMSGVIVNGDTDLKKGDLVFLDEFISEIKPILVKKIVLGAVTNSGQTSKSSIWDSNNKEHRLSSNLIQFSPLLQFGSQESANIFIANLKNAFILLKAYEGQVPKRAEIAVELSSGVSDFSQWLIGVSFDAQAFLDAWNSLQN